MDEKVDGFYIRPFVNVHTQLPCNLFVLPLLWFLLDLYQSESMRICISSIFVTERKMGGDP